MSVSLSLSITQNSQNVAANTSNVTVKATAKWTYGSWNATGECNGSITIDGTKYSFSGIKFNTGQTTTGSEVVMTKTVNVSHNSDGTKKLSCSASFYTGLSSSGTLSASASKDLTTIPRKSTLSVENGTLGTAQTLTITEQASAFVHKLKYSCGDASGYILGSSSATSTALSANWTPPLSLAQQNTTGTSVSITFTLYTYSGSTLIGSNSYTKTFSIPSSVKPSVSVSVSDPTGYKNTYGAYVQGLSKLNIVATASGNQGSTIKSYKTEADGKTYTAEKVTSDVIAGSGTLAVKVTVTDSRGRTATASANVSVLSYASPKISALSVYRCDSEGNASSSGAYLAAKFSATMTSLNNKNTTVYTLKYKKLSETSYTTKTLSDFAGQYSVSNGVYVFAAETSSSYDIILTVNDAIKSVDKTATGSSVKKVWSMLKSAGEIIGIAIGKVAEVSGIDIANDWEVRIHGDTLADFIVESGTSGIWTYRKWASGIAECWGQKKITGYAMTKVTYNHYYGNAIVESYTITFKTVIYKSTTVSDSKTSVVGVQRGTGADESLTSTGNTYPIAFASQTVDITLNHYVKGTWK